ncbi:MAG TPA: hypothetical protein VE689_09170, partial [Candidatus Udaeobacter sp.]|nr:hypothetical protein [Candidatus Udaeobacter sp.]
RIIAEIRALAASDIYRLLAAAKAYQRLKSRGYRVRFVRGLLSVDDIREFPKYEKLWKEIFQIR